MFLSVDTPRATADDVCRETGGKDVTTTSRTVTPGDCATALHAVATARGWVLAAKRTRSRALVEGAERELQAAVDHARDLDVQWGQIGLTLGIARGNAYQRYRKRLSSSDFQADRLPKTA